MKKKPINRSFNYQTKTKTVTNPRDGRVRVQTRRPHRRRLSNNNNNTTNNNRNNNHHDKRFVVGRLSRVCRAAPAPPPSSRAHLQRRPCDKSHTVNTRRQRRLRCGTAIIRSRDMLFAVAIKFAMVSVGMFVSSAGVAIVVIAIAAYSAYTRLNR